MRLTVRGVRSVEIEMSDPDRAAEFYAKVWHLKEIDPVGDVRYLRGTGAYHHILAIRKANGAPSLRRITFDAADRATVNRLHRGVSSAATCEAPREIDAPGGGYGFGFTAPEGRNLAVIYEVADHRDGGDIADRPRKIAHVNVNSADLAGTTRFLVEVLGFRLIDDKDAFRTCDLQLGAVRGCVLFDAGGRYAEVAGRGDRPKFKNAAQPTTEELAAATQNYFAANFGTWSVSEADKTLTRRFEAALRPNNEGSDIKSSVSLAGDELKLSATIPSSGAKVDTVYRRAK